MKIQLFDYKLFYKYAFKIAHTERSYTSALYILLTNGENKAWGEAVFPPYYPETIDSARAFYAKIAFPEKIEELDVLSYIDELNTIYPNNVFAIAGLDIALNNLKSNKLNCSLNQFFNTTESKKQTSFTLGISSKKEMIQKISENLDISYFKLKVNQEEIGRIIEDYLSITNKPFVVDANQGFVSFTEASFWVKELASLNVAYLEQPFHKEDFITHKKLKALSEIPIIADESFQRETPLNAILDSFDGVNIKLMKAGGLSSANRLIDQFSDKGMKIVLGCMSESSLGIKTASCLASKVDWVDLDGHLLIRNDPFKNGHEPSEIVLKS